WVGVATIELVEVRQGASKRLERALGRSGMSRWIQEAHRYPGNLLFLSTETVPRHPGEVGDVVLLVVMHRAARLPATAHAATRGADHEVLGDVDGDGIVSEIGVELGLGVKREMHPGSVLLPLGQLGKP